MKNYLILILILAVSNLFSQTTKDTIYFLVNRKDSLIKKNVSIKNDYRTYLIFFSNKKKVKKNNTPLAKGKVWVADTKHNYCTYGRDYLSFNSFKSNGKLISKDQLNSLNYIDNRDDFLNIKNLLFEYSIFFIEQADNDHYLLYQMYPVFYE